MPERERVAISVVFFPRLRGTVPLARSPFGARAYRGVRAILEPVSSIKTKASVGRLQAFSRHAARSSSFRSVALIDFFFVSNPTVPFPTSSSTAPHLPPPPIPPPP